MLRTRRTGNGQVQFTLSGRIQTTEDIEQLQQLLAAETSGLQLILDLRDVTLVNQNAVEFLRGCERALSEQRIRLIQMEWNSASVEAVGTDRRPLADLLARHGYRLCRPRPDGVLEPLTDVGFGADVFALPAS